MKQILIADDHPLFLEAIEVRLQSLGEKVSFLKASSLIEVVEQLKNNDSIDLALIDLVMPEMNGVDGISKIKSLYPSIPLVIMSATENSTTIRQALEQGASGFIPKSASAVVFLQAIHKVLEGGVFMPEQLWAKNTNTNKSISPRQTDVLELLAEGLSNKLIAARLGLTEGTIKLHVTAILKSLNVHNRTHAVKRAYELNLIT